MPGDPNAGRQPDPLRETSFAVVLARWHGTTRSVCCCEITRAGGEVTSSNRQYRRLAEGHGERILPNIVTNVAENSVNNLTERTNVSLQNVASIKKK